MDLMETETELINPNLRVEIEYLCLKKKQQHINIQSFAMNKISEKYT